MTLERARQRRSGRRGDRGYTFIEILVVTTILLILASAVMPLVQNTTKRYRDTDYIALSGPAKNWKPWAAAVGGVLTIGLGTILAALWWNNPIPDVIDTAQAIVADNSQPQPGVGPTTTHAGSRSKLDAPNAEGSPPPRTADQPDPDPFVKPPPSTAPDAPPAAARRSPKRRSWCSRPPCRSCCSWARV